MMNDHQWAADRLAIQDVMLRYAAGVDERDFAMYRSCFADDVEVLGFGEQAVQGADAWLAYVKEALERFGATQHLLGPPLATINGDAARCRTDVQALHYLKEPQGSTMTLWATYFSEMRRHEDGWKITQHRLVARGTRSQPA